MTCDWIFTTPFLLFSNINWFNDWNAWSAPISVEASMTISSLLILRIYSSVCSFFKENFILFLDFFSELIFSSFRASLRRVVAELNSNSVIISGYLLKEKYPCLIVCSSGLGMMLLFWEKRVFIWEKNIKKTVILSVFMSFNLLS